MHHKEQYVRLIQFDGWGNEGIWDDDAERKRAQNHLMCNTCQTRILYGVMNPGLYDISEKRLPKITLTLIEPILKPFSLFAVLALNDSLSFLLTAWAGLSKSNKSLYALRIRQGFRSLRMYGIREEPVIGNAEGRVGVGLQDVTEQDFDIVVKGIGDFWARIEIWVEIWRHLGLR